jgi:hypothetical protein
MAIDQVQIVMAKRKPNWSESELLALSDVVASNISVIRGQFGPGLGNLPIVYIVPQNRNK